MRHALPLATQFYITAPQPCPYIEGRIERKLFTSLQIEHPELLNNALSGQGFRRSQNILYRPACADCQACMSVRIRVSDNKPSKNQKRVLKKNAHLERVASTPWATEQQYELFSKYLSTRHAKGGMADMDIFEFAAMVEETPVTSRVIEYHDNSKPPSETLSAVCLTDILDDGLSMVYSFFDPDRDKSSLGTYMILDHIQVARAAGLPYVYLGYWVPGSPKMSYKEKFTPLEVMRRGRWTEMTNPKRFQTDTYSRPSSSIAEQVSQIRLPDALGRILK